MAQNQGFFQQGQQFAPVFQQQPQNIYQQLGKPQPQRSHSYDQQQQQQLVPQGFQFAPQQQQPPPQPQYQQPPQPQFQPLYSQPQPPYQPSVTPTYAPVQPPYQQSQTPYQQQYAQQPLVPYSMQQPVYQQQQPQMQLQPQQQPVPAHILPQHQGQLQQPVQAQMQLQQQAQQYVQAQQQPQLPTSSFANQGWRPPSSKPPPISPSASMAKQATTPLPIMAPPSSVARATSTLSSAPTPAPVPAPSPAAGRRPLPQPVPGGNAQPPTIPPGSALRRPPVLPSLNTSSTQSIITSPASASPTRSSRPLPTPKGDVGKLPHGASATVPSLGPISSNSSSLSSSAVANAAANWPPAPQNRTPSPTKPGLPARPSNAERSATESVGIPLSRTANFALGSTPSNGGGESPTKRRASPPRFHAQAASDSSSASVLSSPVKENGPPSTTRSAGASTGMGTSRINGVATNAPPGISPATSTSSNDAAHAASGDPGNNATPKKFTPMWRRTIPEMPAPAWGYAAGMVAEPHPKPKPPAVQAAPPAPPPVVAAPPPEKEKGKGKLAKLLKKKKSAPAVVPPAPAAVVAAPVAAPKAGPTVLNSHYPAAQVQAQYQQRQQQSQQQAQRYAAWQPQPVAQAQPYAVAQNGHQRAPAGYAPRPASQGQEEETEEDDEDDDDEEEETGEEETEEGETEEEESEVDRRPAPHARQYSHQSQASQPQYQQHPQTPQKARPPVPRPKYEEEYGEEYDEDDTPRKATPKKAVLRPKVSPNSAGASYGSYTDASPRRIAEKRAAMEREMEREREREAAPKLRLRPKVAVARSRALEEAEARIEAESERVLVSGGRRRGVVREVPLAGDGPSRRVVGGGHERSRSAFDEREVVRHRREPSEVRHVRRPGSAIMAGERRTRRGYDDYDDEEGYATLAYDDPDDDEDAEEYEEEMEYRKTPKRGVPVRDPRERDWDRRDVVQHRRYESSPQHGNRASAPPMNRRSQSGSAANSRYGDEYEDEDADDVEYQVAPRRTAPITKPARRYTEDDVDNYARRPSGLPHPPSIRREASGQEERQGQRMVGHMGKVKSVPLKYDEFNDQERYAHANATQEKLEFSRQFAKMSVRDERQEGQGRGAPSTDGWPAGLPRLPRTPGSVATPDKGPNGSTGGYFDVRPPSNPTSASSSNFPPRGTPKQAHTPGKANLSLDDPPPRATIIRTPSPGPGGGYTFKRELPQPQGPPQVHTNNQNYPITADKVSEQLARRRSMYAAPSQPVYQPQQPPAQRPQSQIYGNNAPHPPPVQQFSPQLNHAPFNNTRMQQTPAPPQPVGIESPHPIGGREKMADIPKMEEDSNDGSDNERAMIPRISFDSPHQQSPRSAPSVPMINVNSPPNVQAPMINVEPPSIQIDNGGSPRQQSFDQGPKIQVYEVPGVSVSGPQFDDHHGGPMISVSGPDDHAGNSSQNRQHPTSSQPQMGQNAAPRTGGLVCGGCHGPIIGRIVSAMGQRYHPACFKCTVCNTLLEHVSSFEHEGRPYCHLDYHDAFAPKCFSCKTTIVDPNFISLDDPALGKRTYHAQHFFCAECGDPFLSPSAFPADSRGEFALSGDGEFEGFTVYKGYPYCEACHVRLRLPKCKGCKKPIRENDEAVEALGAKWCWGCFVCASCHNPFQNPSFFMRDNQAFCEHCFSVMLRNEV